MTTSNTQALVEFISSSLAAEANKVNAQAMAAYMKTDMPFYGVETPTEKSSQSSVSTRVPDT